MREFEFLVLGGAFALSLAFFGLTMGLFRIRGRWQASVGRSVGKVETAPLGWMNVVGVALVFSFYLVSWSLEWGVWIEDAVGRWDMIRQMFLQVGFAVVMAGMLFDRVSYRKFWGLNLSMKKWLVVMGCWLVGFVVFKLILEALWVAGYDEWALDAFRRNRVWVIGVPEQGLLMTGLWFLVTVLAAPISEEVVFRGYVYPVAKRLGGIWLATVTSSLLFAAAHLDGANLLPTFLLGFLLVAAYEWTGSLWAPIGIHLLNNLFVFLNSMQ